MLYIRLMCISHKARRSIRRTAAQVIPRYFGLRSQTLDYFLNYKFGLNSNQSQPEISLAESFDVEYLIERLALLEISDREWCQNSDDSEIKF